MNLLAYYPGAVEVNHTPISPRGIVVAYDPHADQPIIDVNGSLWRLNALTFDVDDDAAWRAVARQSAELSWDPNQPRDPEGFPTGGQWTAKIPGLSDLTYVKELGGSTGAQLFKDEKGKLWVVKKGKTFEHLKSEHEANLIYAQLGVNVPRGKLFTDDKVRISEFIDGKLLSSLTGSYRQAAIDHIREDFAVDALLANWDVIGMGQDNIIVDKDGVPWRIDNGGSLEYRAQGGLKGSAWNSAVGEIDSMRSPSTPAGKIFAGITNEEIAKQVTTIMEKADALPMGSMLQQRYNTLVQKFHGTFAGKTLAPGAAEEIAGYKAELASAKGENAKTNAASNLAVSADEFGISKGSFLGSTLKEKIYNAKKIAKLNPIQAKKVALLNDGTDDKLLILPSSFTKDQIDAFKAANPGKQLKLVIASKALESKFSMYGVASAHELWHKSFDEPGSLPLAHPSLKPTHKPTGTPKAPLPKSSNPKANLYVSKVFWDEFDSQYSNEYDKDKIYKREKVTTGGSYEFPMEKGNGAYGEKVTAPLSKIPGINSAISQWKGSPSDIHNAELGKPHSPHSAKHAKVIQAARFDPSVPKYSGIAYRGMHGIEPGTHSYEQFTLPGNIVEFNASQGASRNPGMGLAKQPFMLRVATKTGISIEKIGGFHSEYELWLPAGSKWRVVGVAYDIVMHGSKVKTFVDLEEIVK